MRLLRYTVIIKSGTGELLNILEQDSTPGGAMTLFLVRTIHNALMEGNTADISVALRSPSKQQSNTVKRFK